jgi:hypothetical protein
MKWRPIVFCILILSVIVGCQRFDNANQREGLEIDSRSYSYVSFDNSRMKHAARSVKGVEDAIVDYNWEYIMVTVIPKPNVKESEYPELASKVRRKVSQGHINTPFRVQVKKRSEVPPYQSN